MTDIVNPYAGDTPSNYEICQRSGKRARIDTLVRDGYTGAWVLPEFVDPPEPPVRTPVTSGRGSEDAESTDAFISDLYPSGVQPSDL